MKHEETVLTIRGRLGFWRALKPRRKRFHFCMEKRLGYGNSRKFKRKQTGDNFVGCYGVRIAERKGTG